MHTMVAYFTISFLFKLYIGFVLFNWGRSTFNIRFLIIIFRCFFLQVQTTIDGNNFKFIQLRRDILGYKGHIIIKLQ